MRHGDLFPRGIIKTGLNEREAGTGISIGPLKMFPGIPDKPVPRRQDPGFEGLLCSFYIHSLGGLLISYPGFPDVRDFRTNIVDQVVGQVMRIILELPPVVID